MVRLTRARLVTRDGELVANIKIPPMEVPPEILMWQHRIFVKDGAGRDRVAIYGERPMWVVPPLRDMPDTSVRRGPAALPLRRRA